MPLRCGMAAFIYRCPTTGLSVQGWVADNPSDNNDEIFEPVSCAVCARMHLVNPNTGKVLGAGQDDGAMKPT